MAVWILRDKDWPENTQPEDIITTFFSVFRISDEEKDALFETELPISLFPLEVFQREPIKPNPDLAEELQEKIHTTIKRLKLNEDEAFVNDRSAWLKRYCLGGEEFLQLKRDAPFIAYELERQGLVKKIKDIMCYSSDDEEDEW